jgi:hypothetical protein
MKFASSSAAFLWLFFVASVAADDVVDLRKRLRQIERLASNPKPSESVELDLAKAIAALVKSHPDEPAVMFWLGDHQERQGKFADAQTIWKRSLSLASVLPPAEADAVKAKACARVSQGLLGGLDGAGAEQFAKRSMELDPLNPSGAVCLLESAFRTGKIAEAVAALEQASEKHGAKSPGVRVVYHEALARIGEWVRLRAEVNRLTGDERRPEDFHHFQARLAEIDGRPLDSFLYHYLASVGGAERASTTLRSRDVVDKIRYREEAEIPQEILPYAKALNLLDRADSNPDKRTAGVKLPVAGAEPARLVGRYIQLRCSAAANEETVAGWRELLKDYPAFPPIYCGLAEALEVESAPSEEIAALIVKAESLSPTNEEVREHFRMGARWKPSKDGAVATAVEPDTAWGRYRIGVGDELVELDDKKLAEMPIHHRMAYVRRFVGGRVVYKPKGFTNTVERDLELTFFD